MLLGLYVLGGFFVFSCLVFCFVVLRVVVYLGFSVLLNLRLFTGRFCLFDFYLSVVLCIWFWGLLLIVALCLCNWVCCFVEFMLLRIVWFVTFHCWVFGPCCFDSVFLVCACLVGLGLLFYRLGLRFLLYICLLFYWYFDEVDVMILILWVVLKWGLVVCLWMLWICVLSFIDWICIDVRCRTDVFFRIVVWVRVCFFLVFRRLVLISLWLNTFGLRVFLFVWVFDSDFRLRFRLFIWVLLFLVVLCLFFVLIV